MAPSARSQIGADFESPGHLRTSCVVSTATPPSRPSARHHPSVLHDVLHERRPNRANTDTSFSIERLTEEFEHFHLDSPSKENLCDDVKSANPLQSIETRPGHATPTLAVKADAGPPGHPVVTFAAARDAHDACNQALVTHQEQLAKHHAATRMDPLRSSRSTKADAVDDLAAATQAQDVDTSASTIVRMASVPPGSSPQAQRRSETVLADALDTRQAGTKATLARTNSTTGKAAEAKAARIKPSSARRASWVPESSSMALGSRGEEAAGPSPAGPKRKTAPARPASLLPPKPLAKPNRPPIKPTFELPGEAVARRLKEQREARRMQPVSSDEAAAVAAKYSPSKPHVKSTKVPTRPTFELPGEAISRRKREEHEAKIRAQEDEERKRREFKARPIRTSIAPNTFPRETVASRARQGKTQAERVETPAAATAKQARQEAAKRSRLLSREWAEKQRLKKLATAAAGAGSVEEGAS